MNAAPDHRIWPPAGHPVPDGFAWDGETLRVMGRKGLEPAPPHFRWGPDGALLVFPDLEPDAAGFVVPEQGGADIAAAIWRKAGSNPGVPVFAATVLVCALVAQALSFHLRDVPPLVGLEAFADRPLFFVVPILILLSIPALIIALAWRRHVTARLAEALAAATPVSDDLRLTRRDADEVFGHASGAPRARPRLRRALSTLVLLLWLTMAGLAVARNPAFWPFLALVVPIAVAYVTVAFWPPRRQGPRGLTRPGSRRPPEAMRPQLPPFRRWMSAIAAGGGVLAWLVLVILVAPAPLAWYEALWPSRPVIDLFLNQTVLADKPDGQPPFARWEGPVTLTVTGDSPVWLDDWLRDVTDDIAALTGRPITRVARDGAFTLSLGPTGWPPGPRHYAVWDVAYDDRSGAILGASAKVDLAALAAEAPGGDDGIIARQQGAIAWALLNGHGVQGRPLRRRSILGGAPGPGLRPLDMLALYALYTPEIDSLDRAGAPLIAARIDAALAEARFLERQADAFLARRRAAFAAQ